MEVDLPAFNSALSSGKSVILSCNCSVYYSGRAESFLAGGDRIIIIKSDSTLLIHQPHGSTPVNYMKEGSSHTLLKDASKLILSSSNLQQKEYLRINISKIHSLQVLDLADSQKIQLTGSEKDMADMIYNNPALIGSDFKPLSREEHTRYGFIDVFGYDKSNTLVVVECKRYTADLKAVDQLQRYVKKIRQLKGLQKVRGIIAAPKISPNALQLLHDHGFEFRSVSPPKYLEKFDRQQQKLDGF
ncbi:endonuclease NucS [Candidatus Woesearchaeota archaeon]|nr:endonuclease NucS [Candidatus Woesearchaeota archaeon]